jgi:5'-3' exoribonuclease 2
MDIKFELGSPFKPFEQLMGVFPAARCALSLSLPRYALLPVGLNETGCCSRSHIPAAFQPLMVDEDSEIIDFYPTDFSIDMNGKKMLWQGVALLPFIDQKRLLDALATRYPQLTEEEVRRNSPGDHSLYVSEDNPLYDSLVALYHARQPPTEPVRLDPKRSQRISGFVLPDPDCVPGSTYFSPLPSQDLGDINNDRSISVVYSFPPQLTPHRSVLLPGAQPERPVLTPYDRDVTRRGGKQDNGAGNGFHAQRRELGGPGISRFDRGDSYRGGPPKRNFSSSSLDRRSSGGGGGYGGRGDHYAGGGYDSPQQGWSSSSYAPRPPYDSPASSYGGRGSYDSPASSYGAHPPCPFFSLYVYARLLCTDLYDGCDRWPRRVRIVRIIESLWYAVRWWRRWRWQSRRIRRWARLLRPLADAVSVGCRTVADIWLPTAVGTVVRRW